MSIARGLIVLCGLGMSVPALGQQGAAFEYSPVVRLLHNGWYRGEVWRRNLSTDRSEIAWSDAEPALTAAMAIAEARGRKCPTLRQVSWRTGAGGHLPGSPAPVAAVKDEMAIARISWMDRHLPSD